MNACVMKDVMRVMCSCTSASQVSIKRQHHTRASHVSITRQHHLAAAELGLIHDIGVVHAGELKANAVVMLGGGASTGRSSTEVW